MAKTVYRLKNVKPKEVSLVSRPAFEESEWLILKSLTVTFDDVRFTGKPLHPWLHIENNGTDGLLLTCTAVVLAAGDSLDGHSYTAEEVRALQELWARQYARKSTVTQPNAQRYIHDSKGLPLWSAMVVAFGVTDDKGLKVAGAGGKELPGNCWWIQLAVTDDEGIASKIVGDKRMFNGLTVTAPAVLLGKAGRTSTERLPARRNLIYDMSDPGTLNGVADMLAYQITTRVDAARQEAEEAAEAEAEAKRRADELTPQEAGKLLAETVIDILVQSGGETLVDFVTTYHCLSRVHCNTCRTDPVWRAATGAPDVCPFPGSAPVILAAVPADAAEICRACHDAKACPNVSVCCGGKLSVNIITSCPSGKWRSA